MSPGTSSKQTIALVIETGCTSLWGWIQYADNLIVEEASKTEELQFNMSRILLDFHDLPPARTISKLNTISLLHDTGTG